ncbi:RNA polymerase, sigma 54 subunit, RpoN/SigL [Desulfurobacterium pacificum]|uniref:RNA polymerase, sigma 54 subunit, RpoN/SigL n=1 Tax=Desulfurobacterium pacificum TaxID=240166 RepID=A0ABY1N7I4_9BACT|nr:RNA polymerase factor sigma-54 [Desulfurobacterium pacificum]SMP02549.1 RNA polymerase, sigma 54 subunit, RpoN/SigL [Desulfurobacterium pacificum]
MEQGLNQNLELSLQLKLTPGLYLQLELLQLPILKLEEVIKNELEENPFLEVEEEEKEVNAEPIPDFIFEGGNVFVSDEEVEQPIPDRKSLRDILLQQARWDLTEKEFKVAEFIVDNLEYRGFLTLKEEEIADKLGVPVSLVRKVREFVKSLTPVGCASYTVKEAFEAQLKELGASDKYVKAVDYLDVLAKSREEFREKSGLSEDELEEFLSFLRRLDAEPGNMGDFNPVISPDAKVYLLKGKVIVEITEPPTFKLRVNPFYLKYADNKELKKYVNEKYQRALFIYKAIQQRKETLRKIVECVFNEQIEFLKDGKTVKPLNYRQIAEMTGMHESTVSRAVKDKFVETPFGVYPLKFFFKKSVSGTSVDAVKEKIREIIDKEDKRRPLSDSKIAEELKRLGIKIARRTVAKYREEMGIPGAFERRKR